MITFALNAKKYIHVVNDGILLWAGVVLPSLFPYIFLSTLFTKVTSIERFAKPLNKFSKKLFGTSGISFYVLLISFLCGYPIGAKTTAELYERGMISSKEASKISLFCCTSGPVFVLGSVGAVMLNNRLLGGIILLSHLLSSLVLGVCFKRLFTESLPVNPTPLRLKKENSNDFLSESVSASVLSILSIGGYVTLSYLFSEMLDSLYILSPVKAFFSFIFNSKTLGEGFTFGLIECTKGAKIIASFNGKLVAPLITALISFGGCSIILQCLAFYKKAKIKTAVFLLSRVLQAVLSFFICLLFLSLLPSV